MSTCENFVTKYGANIPPDILVKYFERLIGRIFKILPISEERADTLNEYIEYILIEISGGDRLLIHDIKLLELMCNLESLLWIQDDKKQFRSQIFKCMKICDGIIVQVKEGDVDAL